MLKKIWMLLTISLASLFFLSGCGQSGPLYLPADNPTPATTKVSS